MTATDQRIAELESRLFTAEAAYRREKERADNFQLTLQYIADDAETQTSGHFGMSRLAGYASKTLEGHKWLDEFESDEKILKLGGVCFV